MNINRYNYLMYRVEYPQERGYRMEASRLPDWIYITITEEGDSKWMTVYSRWHVEKEYRINPTYSSDFTDRQMLIELSAQVHRMFIE